MPDSEHPERFAGQPTEADRSPQAGHGHAVAPVQPLDVDGTRTVAVGSALFLVAFLALLPFHDRLQDAGRGWWLWTCLTGVGVGAIGWDYCRRRRNTRQRRESAGARSV